MPSSVKSKETSNRAIIESISVLQFGRFKIQCDIKEMRFKGKIKNLN